MVESKSDRRFKIITITALVIIVIALSIAYLSLSKKLTIFGSTKVNETGWNIAIPNEKNGLSPVTSSGGDGNITYETESYDGVTVIKNLKVTLRKPGDFGELTVPIKNAGDTDAYLAYVAGVDGKISCTGTGNTKERDERIICGDSSNNGAEVRYTITYDNDLLTKGTSGVDDLNLRSGVTKMVKIKVEYLPGSSNVSAHKVTVLLPEIQFIFQQVM